MSFKEKYQSYIDEVNAFLDSYIKENDLPEKQVYSAMRYSLMAGGKRLRPVLALAVSDMLEGEIDEVIPFAAAIEMIHTYSLIHDDLPAMDNDDYRRGRLTNHKVYGDALAILSGDGLLNLAFELMLESMSNDNNNLAKKIKAMSYIANSSGVKGMIAGQVIDMGSENRVVSAEVLEYMHRCKTGALIKAPVVASAILCNASEEDVLSLERFAAGLGLAFQIKDDILDVEGNTDKLGKKVGSDETNKKATFISIYGLEESKRMLWETTEEAVRNIERFGQKSIFLREFAQYLIVRET